MEKKYDGFSEKRMHIFGELVRKYWNGNLNSSDDLLALAIEIKEKYGFDDKDIPFIKNHIRVAMGMDPKDDSDFREALDLVRNSKEIGPPVVAKIEGPCEQCSEAHCKGKEVCKYEAHVYKRKKGPVIVNNKCISCGHCVTSCDFGALADKIEFLPVVDLLKEKKVPVYAVVAPAIVGQFGEEISMGQLRTAMKLLGFKDMIEVALFADILTIKEAFEFNHLVKTEADFFLTSCCCPVWFNMTKKNYPEIYAKMSPSVSPMIASGRILKKLYEGSRIVFVAPCIAKKAEIKELGLKGAVDFVLNFRELLEIFKALDIRPETLTGDEKDQASFGGRVYARTGGVSFSVKTVVNRLEPSRLIKLKAKKVHGVTSCKDVLQALSEGRDIHANFIEGMGCEGGCIGGPRTNIPMEKAFRLVNDFGEDSLIMTPFDNLNVMKILKQLGINKIEEIVDNAELAQLLTRD